MLQSTFNMTVNKQQNAKKIAILGSGALGIYYGLHLAKAGHDVSFIVRRNAAALAAHGLFVESSVHANLQLKPAKVLLAEQAQADFDLVVVCFKTTSNHELPKLLGYLCSDATLVLSLQNGMGNFESIAACVGEMRSFSALCFVACSLQNPGVVLHRSGGQLVIGSQIEASQAWALELVALFAQAGLDCRHVPNLLAAQWRKLVWNVPFNGLGIVMGGKSVDCLLADEACRLRLRNLMQEVCKVAAACACPIEPEFIEKQFHLTSKMGPYQPSSVLDYLAGRPLELAAIWQIPLQIGLQKALDLPHWTQLCRELEAIEHARENRG